MTDLIHALDEAVKRYEAAAYRRGAAVAKPERDGILAIQRAHDEARRDYFAALDALRFRAGR